MFISKIKNILGGIFCITLLMACNPSKYIKKNVPIEPSMQDRKSPQGSGHSGQDKSDSETSLGDSENSCFNSVPTVISNYFGDSFEPMEWDMAWKCIDTSIVEFLENVEGKKSYQYKTSELKNFFEIYFFKKTISQDFVQELMLLKQALVGGTTESFTFEEIDQMRLILKTISSALKDLHPQIKVLSMSEELDVLNSADILKIDESIEVLKKTLHKILQVIPLQVANYPIPRIQHLVIEWVQFSQSLKNQNMSKSFFDKLFENSFFKAQFFKNRKVKKYFSISLEELVQKLSFYETVKTTLVGTQIDAKKIEDVEAVWFILAETYKSVLFYNYGIEDLALSNPEHSIILNQWMELNFKILNSSLALKQSHEIDDFELDHLIDQIYSQGLGAESLDKNIIKVLFRIFKQDVIKKEGPIGLFHVGWFYNEYKQFYWIQWPFIQKFLTQKAISSQSIKEFVATYNYREVMQQMNVTSLQDQDNFERSWLSFVYFITTKETRKWNDHFQLDFSKKAHTEWNYTDILMHNLLVRGVENLVKLIPQSQNNGFFNRTFTRADIQALYIKYKEVGVQLKIFDPRDFDSSLSFVNQGDLFTYSGNGDGVLDLYEFTDRIAILYSAGNVSYNQFESYLEINSLYNKHFDIFNKAMVDLDTFNSHLVKNFSTIYEQLPLMNKYLLELDETRKANFLNEVLQLSITCPLNFKGVDSPTRQAFGVVLQYIEQLFVLFDTNDSQFFEENEVESAYPRFSYFITSKTKEKVKQSYPTTYKFLNSIGFDWEGLGKDVFKFIVSKGRIPTAAEILEIKNNNFFWGTQENFKSADRFDIAKVFTTLNQEMGSSTAECLPPSF